MTGMTGPWKEALPGVDAGRSGGGSRAPETSPPALWGLSARGVASDHASLRPVLSGADVICRPVAKPVWPVVTLLCAP